MRTNTTGIKNIVAARNYTLPDIGKSLLTRALENKKNNTTCPCLVLGCAKGGGSETEEGELVTCHEFTLLSIELHMNAMLKLNRFADFHDTIFLSRSYVVTRSMGSRAHQHDELVFQSTETVQNTEGKLRRCPNSKTERL